MIARCCAASIAILVVVATLTLASQSPAHAGNSAHPLTPSGDGTTRLGHRPGVGSTYPDTQPSPKFSQVVVHAAATLAPDERVGRAQRPAQGGSSRKLFAAGITLLGIALVVATAYYVRRKQDGDE